MKRARNGPILYVCDKCGLPGHKLWREYQTVASVAKLLCSVCAEKDQKRKLDLSESDQIGWLVPAIPDAESQSFWGYTSVPQRMCSWWYNLPTFEKKDREIEALRAQLKKQTDRVEYLYEKLDECSEEARERNER